MLVLPPLYSRTNRNLHLIFSKPVATEYFLPPYFFDFEILAKEQGGKEAEPYDEGKNGFERTTQHVNSSLLAEFYDGVKIIYSKENKTD